MVSAPLVSTFADAASPRNARYPSEFGRGKAFTKCIVPRPPPENRNATEIASSTSIFSPSTFAVIAWTSTICSPLIQSSASTQWQPSQCRMPWPCHSDEKRWFSGSRTATVTPDGSGPHTSKSA